MKLTSLFPPVEKPIKFQFTINFNLQIHNTNTIHNSNLQIIDNFQQLCGAFGCVEGRGFCCEGAIMYLTNRFRFSVRKYCNRSQMTSERVKNKKVRTRRSRVRDFLFFTRYGVICDLLQYRSTKK